MFLKVSDLPAISGNLSLVHSSLVFENTMEQPKAKNSAFLVYRQKKSVRAEGFPKYLESK